MNATSVMIGETIIVLRTLTILLGSVTATALAFQVAMISAMDIAYWEAGDASSGWSIWYGVVAVGLLLGATLLLHKPRVASVVYLACLPLVILYERNQNRAFYSLEIPESIAGWIGVMTIILAIMSYLSSDERARLLP